MDERPRNKRWKWAAIIRLDGRVVESVSQTNRYAEVLSRLLRDWCCDQAGLSARSTNSPGSWQYSHMMYCEPFLMFDNPALAAGFRMRWHGEKINFEEELERLIALRHAKRRK